MEKTVKVGVRKGDGSPVYLWSVWILDLAYEEGMKFLNDGQYAYLSEQVRT